jgi:hypothetical protein
MYQHLSLFAPRFRCQISAQNPIIFFTVPIVWKQKPCGKMNSVGFLWSVSA